MRHGGEPQGEGQDSSTPRNGILLVRVLPCVIIGSPSSPSQQSSSTQRQFLHKSSIYLTRHAHTALRFPVFICPLHRIYLLTEELLVSWSPSR